MPAAGRGGQPDGHGERRHDSAASTQRRSVTRVRRGHPQTLAGRRPPRPSTSPGRRAPAPRASGRAGRAGTAPAAAPGRRPAAPDRPTSSVGARGAATARRSARCSAARRQQPEQREGQRRVPVGHQRHPLADAVGHDLVEHRPRRPGRGAEDEAGAGDDVRSVRARCGHARRSYCAGRVALVARPRPRRRRWPPAMSAGPVARVGVARS